MLKFLVSSGSKLNYRLYGEYLFDILFAGGVLGTCMMSVLQHLKGPELLHLWVGYEQQKRSDYLEMSRYKYD